MLNHSSQLNSREFRHEVFVQEKREGEKMSLHGCEHLTSLKAANGVRSFYIIHSYFIACSSTEARRVKVRSTPKSQTGSKNENKARLMHRISLRVLQTHTYISNKNTLYSCLMRLSRMFVHSLFATQRELSLQTGKNPVDAICCHMNEVNFTQTRPV